MSQPLSVTVEQLIRNRMASGRYSSEEELLVAALQSLDEIDEEIQAVEEGLASVERGEQGVPLDEAFNRLRKKHSIPS
jgi:hypothetical protein